MTRQSHDSNVRPVDFSTGGNVVIRVEDLWKEYRLGTINHGTLARDLQSWWARIRGKEDPNLRIDQSFQSYNNPRGNILNESESSERFWALQDVSFDVKQGDILGVIGRNGAGKSTLLKILSEVTTPTKGQIKISGRVASLLEVGTGFHPDLTGRENIFLNGAILGMGKLEIKRKLDEIIDFSEIHKFIDTPVKRYSSGMYVRLAFAVAAHLEPEILVLDEVLAVGDATFQKKCLGKMEEVSKEGRTVIFVSHNMSAIENLCSRGLLLNEGKVLIDDSVAPAIERYFDRRGKARRPVDLGQRQDREGLGIIKSTRLQILDNSGKDCENLQAGERYLFVVDFENHTDKKIGGLVISIDMYDERDNRVMLLRSNFENKLYDFEPGLNTVSCEINDFPFSDGSYNFSIFISHRETDVMDFVKFVKPVTIDGGSFYPDGTSGFPTHCRFLTHSRWS